MTDIDWDANLLKEIKDSKSNNLQEGQSQLDIMLQPITTQQNFKVGKRVFNTHKEVQDSLQKQQKSNAKIENSNLNQQSQKFRNYLNEKVQQLRKSQKINNINQTKSQQNKPQTHNKSTLRNIINQQESKHKNNQKSKIHTNINKSSQIETKKKSMQSPILTPQLKPPALKKDVDLLTQQQKYKRKSTIDNHSGKFHKQVSQKERKQTPQSKNSFRIKRTSNINPNIQVPNNLQKSTQVSAKLIEKQSPIYQGKSKRMRQQFTRLNQQQRRLQLQIFNFHKQTKHPLENIIKKYHVQTSNYQKYGIKKQLKGKQYPTQGQLSKNSSLEKNQPVSLSKKSIHQSKPAKNSQKKINQNNEIIPLSPSKQSKQAKPTKSLLETHLEILNSLLKAKNKEIEKLQLKIQKNPYIKFLHQQPQDIQQQIQEDQQDIVQELPNSNPNKFSAKQFTSTYSSVMSEMKNKKWGLKQRITFQTHRDSSQKKIDHKQQKNDNNFASLQNKINRKHQNSQLNQSPINLQSFQQNYKIQVNDKLKKLLFE